MIYDYTYSDIPKGTWQAQVMSNIGPVTIAVIELLVWKHQLIS